LIAKLNAIWFALLTTTFKRKMTNHNLIRSMFERVRNEPSVTHLYDHYGDVRATIPTKPLTRGMIDLNSDLLPKIEDKDGNLKRPPKGTPAVQTTTIGAEVIRQSLVAQAGAEVIIWKDPTEVVGLPNPNPLTDAEKAQGKFPDHEILMVRKAAYFETIEATPFALVLDGQQVGVTPFPIKRAAIHIDTDSGLQTNTGIYGVRFEFDRVTMKTYPDFEEQVLLSITQGVARTGDAVLLGAIVAANPGAFSLAAAAAADVRKDELRALVGTAGHGASIDNNGVLRAAGIQAELTPGMAATIVGKFNRSAIMIRSNVELIAERVNVNGSVAFTAWAAFQALLPDTSRFWTVAP
jgi:hypothetical protein